MPSESLIGLKRLSNNERRHEEAVILAMGPSRHLLFENPKFVENRSLAVINRAGIDWPNELEYWISYHAEWMSRWWAERELKGFPLPIEAIVSQNKKNNMDHIPHYNIKAQVQGLNSGGTSTLMAAMYLLDIGYHPIHLFGADLTKPYDKERKFWRILKGEPLVFHGDTDWFIRGNFSSEKKS